MDFKVMLTVKEYSKLSGLSEKSIREFTKVNNFPAIKAGVKILIHGEMANKWLGEYASRTSLRAIV